MTSYRFTAVLPERPISPNRKTHWAKRSRINKNIGDTAWVQFLSVMRKDRRAHEPREVSIVYMHPWPQKMDRDNRQAAMKPVLDALVRSDWLVDDKDEWLLRYDVTERVGPLSVEVTVNVPVPPETSPSPNV